MSNDWIQDEFDEAAAAMRRVAEDASFVAATNAACEALVATLRDGGKVLTFGNGGSAADAAHLAEELCGRYRSDRPSLPALALTACGPTLTCIANDYGFEHVFARQIEGHGHFGDIAVAFSTSGHSPNIVRGLEAARKGGLITIGLLGKSGGSAAALCDHALVVPHDNTARIQEVHGLLLHLLCEAAERTFGA